MFENINELRNIYRKDGIVKLNNKLLNNIINKDILNKITNNVIDNIEITNNILSDSTKILMTMETIKVQKTIELDSDKIITIEDRKVLTRIENFIHTNQEWKNICKYNGIISNLVGLICNDDDDNKDDRNNHNPWYLYKEKLNIKPAGTSGFAPHLDNPSLSMIGLCDTFITIMIAIDDMTIDNGCLQVCKGNWTNNNKIPCVDNNIDSNINSNINPDNEGRQGKISKEELNNLIFEDIICESGDIFLFSGWIPHRSGPNKTQLQRRCVFLTFNPNEDGDLREIYYKIMHKKRLDYINNIKN